MANYLIQTIIYTIEEVSFIAHMLVRNEAKENQMIINTYKSLSEDIVYNQKEVCLTFLHILKNEKVFECGDVEEESIYCNLSERSRGVTDYYIAAYFNAKRNSFVLDKARRDYMIREILGIL